jgi:3-dehydroquinate synthase
VSTENIIVQKDLKGPIGDFLQKKSYSQIGLLGDENTLSFCYPLIHGLPAHQIIKVPSGEEHKNIETCLVVWDNLTRLGFDRHSLLIVLGGGVLGDLGGFCAATFKRGIDFLLLPTTLLSQVDASVGGKLGIDFRHLKNHIGLFRQPAGTFISISFLKTLPQRELRSGFAEIIKHCLISDRMMWDRVRSNGMNAQPWEELIHHSITFKRSIVEADPEESGLRKILNFGHTVGHAVEGCFLETGNRIFHGEAVAAGIMVESIVAHKKSLLQKEELDQITAFLKSIFGILDWTFEEGSLLKKISQDKKNKENRILMALPNSIGKAVWDVDVSSGEISEALAVYKSL